MLNDKPDMQCRLEVATCSSRELTGESELAGRNEMKRTVVLLVSVLMVGAALVMASCTNNTNTGVEATPSTEITKQPEYPQYVKGTVTATGWQSKYLGLKFTTPEGYTTSYGSAGTDGVEMQTITTAKNANISATIGYVKNADQTDEEIHTAVTEQFNAIQGQSFKATTNSTAKIAGQDYLTQTTTGTETNTVTNATTQFKQTRYFRVIHDRLFIITVNETLDPSAPNDAKTLISAFTAY